MNDIPLAEDIVIEAFFKIWERRNNFKSRGELKTYMYIIIRKKCLDVSKLQKRRRNRMKLQGPLQPYEPVTMSIANESFNPVDAARKYLLPECNKILGMLFKDNMNNSEVAQRLNLSVNTIKSQRARAMRILSRSRLFDLLIERAEVFAESIARETIFIKPFFEVWRLNF